MSRTHWTLLAALLLAPTSSAQEHTFTIYTRYVSASAGHDTYDGRTPATAMATIQAAYDSLPLEGGTIFLSDERHDVGPGLVLQKWKPLHLSGTRPDGLSARYVSPSYLPVRIAGPVVFSSTPPQYLIRIDSQGDLASGNSFAGIYFELASPTEAVFYAPDTNHFKVRGCVAFNKDADQHTEPWFVVIHHTGIPRGDDASWARVVENVVSGMGLVWFRTESPHTVNQHVVMGNVAFGAPGRTAPAIRGEHIRGSTIIANNLESFPVAVDLFWGQGNLIAGNSGESVAQFIRFDRTFSNLVADFGNREPEPEDILVDTADNTSDNLFLLTTLTAAGDQYGAGAFSLHCSPLDGIITGTEVRVPVCADASPPPESCECSELEQALEELRSKVEALSPNEPK